LATLVSGIEASSSVAVTTIGVADCAGFRMPAIDSRATFTGGRRPKAAKERTRGG
jgi:hypothetical protein